MWMNSCKETNLQRSLNKFGLNYLNKTFPFFEISQKMFLKPLLIRTFATFRAQPSLSYFPYRILKGVDPPNDNEAHLRVKPFINFLDKNLEEGFEFAYYSLLEGLQSKDMDFLNQNLENKLFRKIEGFPSELAEKNLELRIIGNKNEDTELMFSEVSMILGVRLQRDSNPKGLHKNNLKPDRMIKFLLYSPNASFFLGATQLQEIRPLLQIPVTFKSQRRVVLKKKDEAIRERGNEEEWHKVIFECEGANLAESSLFMEMMKFAGKGIKKEHEMGNIFQKFFFTKDSEWKITDIDDFLEGNPF